MKTLIKKITPKWLLSLYHYSFAILANIVFGRPSRKLIVIGITGTKGKTSVANFIWPVLQSGGIKTGIISTANIKIGEDEEENNFHMTMPGRFFIQKTLSRMVNEKCDVAIVETTSQGIEQFRHIGIEYDVAIFTNLTPEHIESHGSFENYKKAKGKLFETLSKYKPKKWNGEEFPKTIVANSDSDSASYFLNFKANQKKTFSIDNLSDFKAENIKRDKLGSFFDVNGKTYRINLPGLFNIYNALPAIVLGSIFNIGQEKVFSGLGGVLEITGRMEEIRSGKDFRVFVDYAHEPAGLQSVLEASNFLKENGKVIVLIGCAGGGRDKARRSTIGSVAGTFADVVIISDDEPYEEDPKEIREEIKKGAILSGKKENENLFEIGDRKEGIKKALSLAKSGDVVIFTGLGHQKVRMIGKEAIPWVEKEIVKEELTRSNA